MRGAGRMTHVSPASPAPGLRRTLLGTACFTLQPLVLNAVSVPVIAYIIHRLGPEGYAQWMVATSLLAVGAVLTNLGLRAAFVRAVAADPAGACAALAEQLGLRLMLAVVAGAIAVAACLALGYPSAVLWCAAVGVLGLGLTTIATTLADMLQALQRMTVLASVNMVAGLVLTSVSLLAAWRGAGPVWMAVAYVSGPAVSAVPLPAGGRKHGGAGRGRLGLLRGPRVLAGSRFFAAQQLLFAGSSQVEALVLPRLIGLNPFGVFTAGAMPANRLMSIPDGLAAAAYPTMVRACARGPAGGARLVGLYAVLGGGGGGLIALAGMLVAEPIGRILLPGHSAVFAMVVQITIWSLPLTALELVMGYALNACGKDAVQARLALPASIASLLCSVGLVWGFGLTGACWSMVLRPAVRGAFLLSATLRTFGAREANPIAGIAPPLAVAPLRKAG